MQEEKNTKIIEIKAQHVSYSYKNDYEDAEDKSVPAVKDISLQIEAGSYVAILGPNGSGKSTFAKLIDILEQADSGELSVFGLNTKDEESFWDIRENCAYIFQNPDNQIVGTIVEEDVAFGPENIGVKLPELRKRVDKALEYVGLKDMAKRQAAQLSGGQKQKLAIAGALAMRPKLLIMDESTAMLDPQSRDEFLSIVERMQKEQGLTLVTITHDMTEASSCEKIFVVEKGQITTEGKPEEIFLNPEKVRRAGLELPEHIALITELAKLQRVKLSKDDLVSKASCIAKAAEIACMDLQASAGELRTAEDKEIDSEDIILSVKDLSYSYEAGAPKILDGINLDVRRGEILAVAGRSGCGKTTLISHLNGLISPTEGKIEIYPEDGITLSSEVKKDKGLFRKYVGLVFQYPEYQLFEETVYKDIEYGLKKNNTPEDKRKELIIKAARSVGLDEEKLSSNPFELSGGQKRRAAIAGVIAMTPKILVLDEPASGLDPRGRREMFSLIKNLKEQGTTIILVSHNMDEVARYADRVCYMEGGKLIKTGAPQEVFAENNSIPKPLLYDCAVEVHKAIEERLHTSISFGPVGRNAEEEAKNILASVLRAKEAASNA